MKSKAITTMILFLASVFIFVFYVAPAAATPDDNIVGLWHFDEGTGLTAADSSGDGNDGTLTNMDPATDWVAGKFGMALDFDGINDYVRVPDSETYEVSTGTIKLWFKTDTNFADTSRMNGYLIGKQASDGISTFSVVMLGAFHHSDNGGKLLFWIRDSDGSNSISLESPTRLDDGFWHHVACVWGSEGMKLYIDGVEVASDPYTGWWDGNTTDLGIGDILKGGGALPYAFDGVIDEVRIYDRVLCDDEIAAQAGLTCVAPPANLVGWWPGDQNANDIVGGNDGELVGGATFVSPGNVGDAFTFSISAIDYVRVPNQPSLEPAQVTVDAWVRAPVSPGSNRYIVAKGAHGCSAASYALYTSGGGLSFYVYNGSSYVPSPNAGNIWDNQWHHVAGTYDGSSVRLFVDGAEVGSGTPTNISIGYGLSPDNDLIFGRFTGTCSNPFKGDIDEVEVFNRALSLAEIQDIFAAGRQGKCKVIEVEIDIKPGSYPNSINLGSHGVIPVAILSSACFEATTVDAGTVELAGAGVAVRGKAEKLMAHLEDVNEDGLLDLVVQVVIDILPDSLQDGYAILTGFTDDGEAIVGSDEIIIVPLKE